MFSLPLPHHPTIGGRQWPDSAGNLPGDAEMAEGGNYSLPTHQLFTLQFSPIISALDLFSIWPPGNMLFEISTVRWMDCSNQIPFLNQVRGHLQLGQK